MIIRKNKIFASLKNSGGQPKSRQVRSLLWRLTAGLLFLSVASCNQTLDQRHRDTLRYGSIVRGEETFRLPEGMDSLTAGKEASEASLRRYRRYRASRNEKVIFRPELEEAPGVHPNRKCFWYTDDSGVGQGFWICLDRAGNIESIQRDWQAAYDQDPNRQYETDQSIDPNQTKERSSHAAPECEAVDGTCFQFRSEDGTIVTLDPDRYRPYAWRTPDGEDIILDVFDEDGGLAPNSNTPLEDQTLPSAFAALSASGKRNDMDMVWSRGVLNAAKGSKVTTTEKGKTSVEQREIPPEMVRALSSTASIAQMRDLLTEPSFTHMLPITRTVQLGCLPPPESAAFTAATSLHAEIEARHPSGAEGRGKLDHEFASSVTKLFEESERTVFLQYALFRLCELSLNAPSEFSNVYPVVVHDIVRRTAEMNEWVEYQKTKQLELQLALENAKKESTKAAGATPTPTATATKPTVAPPSTTTATPTATPTMTSTTTPTQTPTISPTTNS